ncbi:MAG: DUF6714 family protein [Cyanobacteria bacterium P01_D01_bin.1]
MDEVESMIKESSYNQRKLALIQEITAAFDGVAREDGVTLHEATVLDDYGGPEERAKARAQDTEKRWQEVPERDIRCEDAVLSFLDAKGFRYYIPAYMIWYLRHIDGEGIARSSMTFDSVVFHLTHPIETGKYGKFEMLTTEQSRAIAHFLILEAEREEAIESSYLRASLSKGGMSKEDIEPIIRAHDFQDNSIARSLNNYWKQFL